jgi:predicted signal transduction protein with EAL and GGDEF domain
VAAYNAAPKGGHELSLSVGSVCVEPDSIQTVEELLADADAVMYAKKRAKKDSSRCQRLDSSYALDSA